MNCCEQGNWVRRMTVHFIETTLNMHQTGVGGGEWIVNASKCCQHTMKANPRARDRDPNVLKYNEEPLGTLLALNNGWNKTWKHVQTCCAKSHHIAMERERHREREMYKTLLTKTIYSYPNNPYNNYPCQSTKSCCRISVSSCTGALLFNGRTRCENAKEQRLRNKDAKDIYYTLDAHWQKWSALKVWWFFFPLAANNFSLPFDKRTKRLWPEPFQREHRDLHSQSL